MDDVIERIERSNLDGNATQSQLVEQPRSSHKGPPKWLIKTLESVHPGEVGKTRTMSSTRQDGGDVDDMDVSYDCNLNLNSKVDDCNLSGYFDSNFVGDKENGVSTSGYLMSLGSTTVS